MCSRIFKVGSIAVFLAAFIAAVQPQDDKFIDKTPPKYEYGYVVSDKEGNAQGHVESRDGVFALGRYYVNSPSGSGQKVTYFADDLGYHPLVTYASNTAKGSSRTQFAMGEKAIAALHNNVPGDIIKTVAVPSFTSANLAILAQGPDFSANPLAAPVIVQTPEPIPSESPIPTYQDQFTTAVTSNDAEKEILAGKQTILHVPGLRQALRLATDTGNISQVVNLTAEVGTVGSDKAQEIVRLSSYLQPPDNASSGYNTDVQAVQEPLTEEEHQNLYSAASDVYFTTTMKPIVVSSTGSNSVSTNVNGQSGFQTVDNTLKRGDLASQSSNSIAEQLAPLQAGLTLLSAETKPVEEPIENEPVKYKTVVDIQEGISVDVKEDEDGNLVLANNFGDRIPVEKPAPIQGLAYERRLVNPVAQAIVKETDPVVKEHKEADLLARQEAEILAVQKSIQELQEQIISQIDAEHAQQEQKQENLDKKVESEADDQNSIQSSNLPVQVAPSEESQEPIQESIQEPIQEPIQQQQQQQFLGPAIIALQQPLAINNPLPDSYADVERASIGNNQIETLPRTVKSQNLAGILTLNPVPQPPVNPLDDTYDLVPPLLPSPNEPVLVEPFQVDEEPKLLPPPSPTLFPVKLEEQVAEEKPTVVEKTTIVEKPVVVKDPVEYTKVVQVEKPVPVLQPYPVEVTKVVHVDRPVAVPQPVAVSHPVPVPVAVPHPVEVPVPVHHLIPVPELLPITLKEYYPIYIQKTKHKQSRPKPEKLFTPEPGVFNTEVVKNPEFRVRPEFAAQHGDLQFSDDGLRQALEHFREREPFQRGQHFRNKNNLRNLRIEYGFKPPLRPSVEITEEVKPSIYGPSIRSD